MTKQITLRERVLQSRGAIELLSSKWRIVILHLLRDGALRTSQIQAAIPEISAKVLTQTVRGMERDGLLRREIHNVMPPRVEYELTAMGRSVIAPLENLCHWAKAHIEQRDAARASFDQGRGR